MVETMFLHFDSLSFLSLASSICSSGVNVLIVHIKYWWVVWNMFFSHSVGIHNTNIHQLTFTPSFFRRVESTTNQNNLGGSNSSNSSPTGITAVSTSDSCESQGLPMNKSLPHWKPCYSKSVDPESQGISNTSHFEFLG